MAFSIDILKIAGNVEALKQLVSEVQSYKEGIDQIHLGEQFSDLKKELQQIGHHVEGEAEKLKGIQTALAQIMAFYLKSENKLIGTEEDPFLALGGKLGAKADADYEYKGKDGTNITFHMGAPKAPEFKYDNDFPYDPNAKPTAADRVSWLKWKILNEGAQHLGEYIGTDVPDGVRGYEHYRSGKGTDLEINYARAYKEDENIQAGVDKYLGDTQRAVEQMIASGKKPPFSISSELMSIGGKYYPKTENWQKALGAHQIWISADVTMDTSGKLHMTATVHELDRYNFNSGAADIASGAPDNENGRFETLGWAKSFNTVGEAAFKMSWDKGHISNGSSSVQGAEATRNDRYSPYTRAYRETRDPRDSKKYRDLRSKR